MLHFSEDSIGSNRLVLWCAYVVVCRVLCATCASTEDHSFVVAVFLDAYAVSFSCLKPFRLALATIFLCFMLVGAVLDITTGDVVVDVVLQS